VDEDDRRLSKDLVEVVDMVRGVSPYVVIDLGWPTAASDCQYVAGAKALCVVANPFNTMPSCLRRTGNGGFSFASGDCCVTCDKGEGW
jgi:hypothetical protein